MEKIIKIMLESIREDNDQLNQFFIENDIDIDNLHYLGSGDFGEAYSIGDSGRVLKKTSSKGEFELAQQIQSSDSPVFNAFAKIYATAEIDGQYYIILEELNLHSQIENLYYELESYLQEQNLPIQYLDYLDLDEIEMSEDLQAFINDMHDINMAYRYLGVEASDIRPENLGYSQDGKLKAFDIEDKRR